MAKFAVIFALFALMALSLAAEPEVQPKSVDGKGADLKTASSFYGGYGGYGYGWGFPGYYGWGGWGYPYGGFYGGYGGYGGFYG